MKSSRKITIRNSHPRVLRAHELTDVLGGAGDRMPATRRMIEAGTPTAAATPDPDGEPMPA